MRRVILGIVVALAACSSNPPAPSCVEAFGHYDAAGCLGGALPDPQQEQKEVADDCDALKRYFGPSCNDEFDDWLRCIDNAKTYDDCHSCDQEWFGGLGSCRSPGTTGDHEAARSSPGTTTAGSPDPFLRAIARTR
jgi:hypothetical protein